MLRVVFAGSPDCAVPSLEALAAAHTIVAVLTNAPAPAGRSSKPVRTAVALAAERLKQQGLIAPEVPVLEPERLTDEVRAMIRATGPDIMACFAYGKIFSSKTLALFPLGALNVHPSLLPKWRGCAPVPAVILAGEPETGVTIQKMALEMDAGDIILQKTLKLTGRETAEELLNRAALESAPMLVDAVNRFERGETDGIPQKAGDASYSSMLCKEDGQIDWNRSAREIDARIRAYTPWPGAFTYKESAMLIIHRAHIFEKTEQEGTKPAPPGTVLKAVKGEGILVSTGNGILAIEQLQWRSKKSLDWKSFMNGTRDFEGSVLGPLSP